MDDRKDQEKELSDREATKIFWEEGVNKKCATCVHKCKQSAKVVLINCKEYLKKENENEEIDRLATCDSV